MTIQFKDFVPDIVNSGFMKWAEGTPIKELVATANQWIEDENISVINVETVIAPFQKHKYQAQSIFTPGAGPYHYQVIRVWYKA